MILILLVFHALIGQKLESQSDYTGYITCLQKSPSCKRDNTYEFSVKTLNEIAENKGLVVERGKDEVCRANKGFRFSLKFQLLDLTPWSWSHQRLFYSFSYLCTQCLLSSRRIVYSTPEEIPTLQQRDYSSSQVSQVFSSKNLQRFSPINNIHFYQKYSMPTSL